MIKNSLIYLKGEDRTNDIEDCYIKNNKLCVIFKRNNDIYEYNEASYKIVNKICVNNIFNYFCEISKKITIKNDETNKEESILGKEYDKLADKPLNKKSALYLFLNPDKLAQKKENTHTIIYPFSSNISQSMAIDNALTSQISLIEGPPGTGKTQTILNIIANLVAQNKTVAVVSNNNSAIDNVYEKLNASNFGYICAFLGNNANKDKFIANQSKEYPEYNELYEEDNILKKIDVLNNQAYMVSKNKNRQAELKQELYQIQLEYNYFENQVQIKSSNQDYINMLQTALRSRKITSSTILYIKNRIEYSKKITLWFKFKLIFIIKFGTNEFYKNDISYIFNILDKLFYELKINEITNELNIINEQLQNIDSDSIMEQQKMLSQSYFITKLSNKYAKNKERKIFKKEDLKNNGMEILKEYPVILSTTYSIKSTIDIDDNLFDYIIIDEASQVDLVTGVLALSVAKNAVIVGDTKQLTHIIEQDKIKDLTIINAQYNISENYDFIKNNLLSACLKIFQNVPHVLLREHYRCHPKIIGFCNQKFYNNQLIILSKDNNENDVLQAVYTSMGNHEHNKYNQREIDEIYTNFLPELSKKVEKNEIGIISPYLKQKDELVVTINNQTIQVDTVHKYQGRERDAVIFTTVRNDINDFINNSNLINVAVSRAKKYFRIVASYNITQLEKNNISDLFKYIKYHRGEVKQSSVNSIFDMLYEENRLARIKYLKDKKKISKYDSENIAYNILKNVIDNYDNLKLLPYIPLSRIIKDYSLLDNDEVMFIHTLSHVDLLIINSMDKMPVCAIEIDGISYHSREKQKNRDSIKDSIFKKNNIPLIRLSTKGSGEIEKITGKLFELGYIFKPEI